MNAKSASDGNCTCSLCRCGKVPQYRPLPTTVLVSISLVRVFGKRGQARSSRFPHDFRVTPGSFDLESRTALLEPGEQLTSLVVFELILFMAPDER